MVEPIGFFFLQNSPIPKRRSYLGEVLLPTILSFQVTLNPLSSIRRDPSTNIRRDPTTFTWQTWALLSLEVDSRNHIWVLVCQVLWRKKGAKRHKCTVTSKPHVSHRTYNVDNVQKSQGQPTGSRRKGRYNLPRLKICSSIPRFWPPIFVRQVTGHQTFWPPVAWWSSSFFFGTTKTPKSVEVERTFRQNCDHTPPPQKKLELPTCTRLQKFP